MISLLISAYNQDVLALVKNIHQQCLRLGLAFEIVIHENGTDSHLQTQCAQALNGFDNVLYFTQTPYKTRASSRNGLAQRAKFDLLLFLDGDASVVDSAFIERYIAAGNMQNVVVGGTAYRNEVPSQDYLLRWVYGRKREAIGAELRNQNPYTSFSSFNFMCPKAIMLKVPFDETIVNYGHEDTMLGKEFQYHCIPVVHINNPCYHDGLDPVSVFLEKSKEAVKTLHQLILAGRVDEDIKLYKYFAYLKKVHITGLAALFFKLAAKEMEAHLSGKNPQLWVYDIYRLAYLCSLK